MDTRLFFTIHTNTVEIPEMSSFLPEKIQYFIIRFVSHFLDYDCHSVNPCLKRMVRTRKLSSTAYFSDSGGGGSPYRDLQHQTNTHGSVGRSKARAEKVLKFWSTKASIFRIVYNTAQWYFSQIFGIK